LRTLCIVWNLVRRRVTRRLTRLQTLYNVLKYSKTWWEYDNISIYRYRTETENKFQFNNAHDCRERIWENHLGCIVDNASGRHIITESHRPIPMAYLYRLSLKSIELHTYLALSPLDSCFLNIIFFIYRTSIQLSLSILFDKSEYSTSPVSISLSNPSILA